MPSPRTGEALGTTPAFPSRVWGCGVCWVEDAARINLKKKTKQVWVPRVSGAVLVGSTSHGLSPPGAEGGTPPWPLGRACRAAGAPPPANPAPYPFLPGAHFAVYPFTESSLSWQGAWLFVHYYHCSCCYYFVVRTRKAHPLSKLGEGHQVSGAHSLLSSMCGAWSSQQRPALFFSFHAASARGGAPRLTGVC